jgi:hypothetical protein
MEPQLTINIPTNITIHTKQNKTTTFRIINHITYISSHRNESIRGNTQNTRWKRTGRKMSVQINLIPITDEHMCIVDRHTVLHLHFLYLVHHCHWSRNSRTISQITPGLIWLRDTVSDFDRFISRSFLSLAYLSYSRQPVRSHWHGERGFGVRRHLYLRVQSLSDLKSNIWTNRQHWQYKSVEKKFTFAYYHANSRHSYWRE